MTYIIDGHNLIPHVAGIHLSDMDDEEALIVQLQVFRRVRKRAIVVFFDNAAPGHSGVHTRGTISVHHVRAGTTADSAILQHLNRLKNAAKNVTVVTSDRQVMAGARQYQATLMESPVFARELSSALLQAAKIVSPEIQPDKSETDYWLEQFTKRKKSD